MASGKVKWFDNKKGFGFITPDDAGPDLFVHHTGIEGKGFKSLEMGDEVSFSIEHGDKGAKAVQVRMIQSAQAAVHQNRTAR